jgi:hypothetical protein
VPNILSWSASEAYLDLAGAKHSQQQQLVISLTLRTPAAAGCMAVAAAATAAAGVCHAAQAMHSGLIEDRASPHLKLSCCIYDTDP